MKALGFVWCLFVEGEEVLGIKEKSMCYRVQGYSPSSYQDPTDIGLQLIEMHL